MDEQPSLFDDFGGPDFEESDPKLEAFYEFHWANPGVYTELRNRALKLKQAGHGQYGINGLVAVVRYMRDIQTVDPGGSGFKINNDYNPYYARLLMENEPELVGFFVTRGDIEL